MYKNLKIIPQLLQKDVVKEYHMYLLHAGMDRTEAIICQHFYCVGIRKSVQMEVTSCDTCQLTKRSIKKYGKFPAKLSKEKPWNKLCVYLIGLNKIHRKGKWPIILKAVTMIFPINQVV